MRRHPRRSSASTETIYFATPGKAGFVDFDVSNGDRYEYSVTKSLDVHEIQPSGWIQVTPREFRSSDDFLELLERTAFQYFWRETNPTNGLIRDRSSPLSKCSIAAVGFGLSAIPIAVERGWISRERGRERVMTTLQTFVNGDQSDHGIDAIGNRGWYYHFLEMDTAHRAWNCELSTIDTALFLVGALDAALFFDGENATENAIRNSAKILVDRVDWPWFKNGKTTFSMGWSPEKGFIERHWVGYNEAMLLYILALGSTEEADHDERIWNAWTAGYEWQSAYGEEFVLFPPLFGHQYSHCWIDFRNQIDDWMRNRNLDYFENSRRATLAQWRFCRSNPNRFEGYGPWSWGLTACDGPGGTGFHSYAARGAPPAEMDDGTLAPSAVGGSMAFAPEICLPTLHHWYETDRKRMWTAYGFRDAFNFRANWFDPDVLGIDQGPILLMIENYRTGSTWNRLKKHPTLQRGLRRANFR